MGVIPWTPWIYTPVPSAYRVPPGTRLNGIYEIDLVIGFGGMGEVY